MRIARTTRLVAVTVALVWWLAVVAHAEEEEGEGVDPNADTVTCEVETADEIVCHGVTFVGEELDSGSALLFDVIAAFLLTVTAGFMSGLTMGLMSLDLTNLEIIKQSGSPQQVAYASRILPIVKRHHLLLVSLLLGNALCMEALPIVLDRIFPPFAAVLISVTAVLIFGEIVPQAACTRYGLAIGANLSPIVWCVIAVFFPVAWPIARVLDFVLGESHYTFYKRQELASLVAFNSEGGGKQSEGHHDPSEFLSNDECSIIQGALQLKVKTAETAMTPYSKVFSIDFDAIMDVHLMQKICEDGHSRIPVVRGKSDNIMGVLLTKSLLMVNPADNHPVSSLAIRRLPNISTDMPLYDLLNLFRTGKSHMAIVLSAADHTTVVGLITLEDVIEELMGVEILDETDVFVDVVKRIRVMRNQSTAASSSSGGGGASGGGAAAEPATTGDGAGAAAKSAARTASFVRKPSFTGITTPRRSGSATDMDNVSLIPK